MGLFDFVLVVCRHGMSSSVTSAIIKDTGLADNSDFLSLESASRSRSALERAVNQAKGKVVVFANNSEGGFPNEASRLRGVAAESMTDVQFWKRVQSERGNH
jgi:hypothetical protein